MLAASHDDARKTRLESAAGSRADEHFLLPSSRSESTRIRSVDDKAGDNEA